MSEFKRIPPEQAQALREQGAVVVDVRDPATFAALHISGSKHLDNHSLHAFIQGADLDAPTVVVCYHGNSSQGAAAYLVGQGVRVAEVGPYRRDLERVVLDAVGAVP